MRSKSLISIVCGLSFVAISILSSCRLGKEYTAPELNIPEIYKISPDSVSLADVQWWTIYSDTILQQLILRTLDHNKSIGISEARIRELAYINGIASTKLLPEVNGQVYTNKERLNYGGHNPKNDPETGIKLTASWEVDLWGKLRWAKSAAIAQWMESIENKRALQMSIVAQVATCYFELVALDQELAIVRQTLCAREESERIAKLRYEGGLTSETTYLQSKVETASTATRIPVLERDISLKEHEISLLTGDYPHSIERASHIMPPLLSDTVPQGISSSILLRRPDLMAAEQSLKAANAAVGIAYTNRLPSITLTASGGLESEEFVDLLKSPFYFLQGAITGPVFNFGRNQKAYKAKQAAYEAACLDYQQQVLKAFTEVSDAIIEYNKARDIKESMKKLQEASKTAMDLANLQYINGVVAYFYVLDAQRSYFEAQINFSKAQLFQQLALISLYKSLGGGWTIR